MEDPRVGRGEIIMLGRLVPFAGEDVGEGIQKLEDIRWKTIMWAEEGRKKREWRGELEEREKEWEKEERAEEEDVGERRDMQSGTGSQKDAATEVDEAEKITSRALVSSYHNVLTRLAASTSELQSSLSRSHSEETDLTRVIQGGHDRDEHERFHVNENIVAEQNNTANMIDDLQLESSISSVEDIYSYDYHQVSEILEERSSQFTKSRPSKKLSSKPSSGSTSGVTVPHQSPVVSKKKTNLSSAEQSSINFSMPFTDPIRLTKSNLDRLHNGQESEEEDKIASPPTIQATIRPLNTATPFCLAGTVNAADSLGKLTT